MSRARWLIVGCGYTGAALARRLVAAGQDVVVTRRDAATAAATARALGDGVRGIAADLRADALALPAADVVACLAPPGDDPAAEMRRLACAARGARLIYVSSTGVYAPGGGAWVDEAWPTEPITASGRARLAAERALPADAIRLRAAGIHGPGRGLVERLRAGTYRIVGDGSAHVSRIHVDDLAAAIELAAGSRARGALNAADDAPDPIGLVADTLAAQLGLPPPRRVPIASVDPELAGMLAADRRIANAALKRELGLALRYPSWRALV